jgi:hypothetical protein
MPAPAPRALMAKAAHPDIKGKKKKRNNILGGTPG